MAIPLNTTLFPGVQQDPRDRVDYLVDCSKGLLENAETIASYTITLRPEAAALGMMISSAPYAPSMPSSSTIKFWIEFDPTYQSNVAFDGAGQTLGVEIEIVTNNVPARRRQRTVGIQVAQQ